MVVSIAKQSQSKLTDADYFRAAVEAVRKIMENGEVEWLERSAQGTFGTYNAVLRVFYEGAVQEFKLYFTWKLNRQHPYDVRIMNEWFTTDNGKMVVSSNNLDCLRLQVAEAISAQFQPERKVPAQAIVSRRRAYAS